MVCLLWEFPKTLGPTGGFDCTQIPPLCDGRITFFQFFSIIILNFL